MPNVGWNLKNKLYFRKALHAMSSQTPLDQARTQLNQVAAVLRTKYQGEEARFDKAIKILSTPDMVHEGELSIKMDDGSTQQFKAFRSQHNNARGPYKGGIRFHQGVTKEEVMALSIWMTWKCAVTGIPYGGGKGGIIVNPRELSTAELERLSRAYVRFLGEAVGPWTDIPAPDVNTNGQIMAWMVDEWQKLASEKTGNMLQVNPLAAFTGKPLSLGGSEGRDEATGLGGVYVLEELRKALNWEHTKEITIAIQGFGNVGYWFAHHADALGYRVVAVSDSQGGTYVKDGLNPEKTLQCKKENGHVSQCSCNQEKCDAELGRVVSNEELLELDVDVLVPAALENVITVENADRIKAKVVIEMANGPVTPEAEEILLKKGILVVPDVLANAGGVSTSYFEWVQNLHGTSWDKPTVLLKLQPLMVMAFCEIWEMAQAHKLSLRMATYSRAVKRVIDAMLLRGVA
jgi:glutamate dehydrogenase/leucine dehydrogenase